MDWRRGSSSDTVLLCKHKPCVQTLIPSKKKKKILWFFVVVVVLLFVVLVLC
jgi:hypothetical protein